MRPAFILRNATLLGTFVCLAGFGCGVQADDAGGAINFGGAPSGGAGAANGPGCTDCKGLSDREDSGGYTEVDSQNSGGGAGGTSTTNPGLSPSCGALSGSARVIESSLGNGASFASAQLTRELLNQGIAPLPQHVRTQDLLNYFPPSFDGPTAPNGNADPSEPKVLVEMAPRSIGAGQNSTTDYDLLVAVQAPNTKLVSPPEVLIVIDSTESMTEDGLERGKFAAASMISMLPEATAVRVRTSDPEVQLTPAPAGAPRDQLLAELSQITRFNGERPFSQTLRDAYTQVPLEQGARVFAITDGADAPETISSDEIEAATAQNIVLSSIAVGPALEHGDRFFRALAWVGRGHYFYLDKAEEADAVFAQHLGAMLQTELLDVRVQLLLPWYFRMVRSATEETLNFQQAKPQNMGAGAVGSYLYRLRACDASLPVANGADEITITVRYKRVNDDFIEVPVVVKMQSLLNAPSKTRLTRAVAIQSYAESLKTLDARRLEDAHATLQAAASASGDAALNGLAVLLGQHPLLPNTAP